MAYADWEYSPDTDANLYRWDVHSPPYSLDIYTLDAVELGIAYCTDAATLCIPEGRVVAWIWHYDEDTQPAAIVLRGQDAVGSITDDNCYFVKIYDGHAAVYSRVAGVNTLLDDFYIAVPNQVFVAYRVTWAVQGAALVITVEKSADGVSWALVGTCNTGTNLWAASSVNRIGFGVADIGFAAEGILLDDVGVFRRLPT